MAEYLEQSLTSFRSCFTRQRAFRSFVILVVALILREDHLGVTSAVRALCLNQASYDILLHFFRSGACRTSDIREHWYCLIRDKAPLLKVDGRVVLAGDGVKQSKEGFFMPGVKKLHQESEDSSKGSYIFGHLFGAVGVMIGTMNRFLCLPLRMSIQDGVQHAAGWNGSTVCGDSHVVQIISNGYEAARILGSSIFILDRYFLTVPALMKMNELNASESGSLLTLVTKAKRNCRAFEKPEPKEPGKRGRPRKKGKAVFLNKLFEEETDRFRDAKVTMYGKLTDVRLLSKDLLWGQKLYQELRFVLVVTGDMRCILVSTDISLTPEQIIELYAMRFKIESCFREFKQWFGGFGYHFWTKAVSRLNHYKKKEEPDRLVNVIDTGKQRRILKAIDATERFVQLACIAMGLVQMMIFREEDISEIQNARYLRTKKEGTISEETLKYYLRRRLLFSLAKRPESCIMHFIQELQSPPPDEKAA